jgi:hypothetical protein
MNLTYTQIAIGGIGKSYKDALEACFDLIAEENVSKSPIGVAAGLASELSIGLLDILNALACEECVHDTCASSLLDKLHTKFADTCKLELDALYKVKKP